MTDARSGAAAQCRAIVAALPVQGAAFTLMTSDTVRETLYASDPTSAEIARLQFSLGEGPTLAAFASGHPVLLPDLRAAPVVTRWPVFAQTVEQLPAGALFAFPMRLGAITVGVCETYRRGPGPLTPAEVAGVLRAVDLGTLSVLAVRADGAGADLDGSWLDGHDLARRQVYQATGMLIAQLSVPAEQAFARLRAHAYLTGHTVEQIAADIVARRVRLEADPAP